jgi:radical SAM protein with 4Fe4S-binding SPASM domain
LNVFIATNGSLLDEEMAHRLIDVRLSKIMISLDATTAETYRKMRNSVAFEKVKKNILGLLELRSRLGVDFPLVRVNFLRTALNAHEADDFLSFWKDKVDMVGFQDQLGIPGVESSWLATSDRSAFRNFRCSFPFKHIVVATDGRLLPCCTFSGEKHSLGNIKTLSIREAWTGAYIESLRALHREGKYKENPVCSHCVGNGGPE